MSRIGMLAALVVFQFTLTLSAREWTSRTGESLGDAELVDAGQGMAVLKQTADGKLKVVQFSQLSLGDVQYIREAMNAAGVDLETHKPVLPAGTTTAPAPAPAPTSTTAPAATAQQGGPPLAVAGKAGWQVAVDPAPEKWTVTPTQLRIQVPKGFSEDDILFTSTSSPFVLLGGSSSDAARELWDLRRGERVGLLRQADRVEKTALSPDGRYLATHSSRASEQLNIWSFESNSSVRQIALSDRSGSVYGVDFATPGRIVASLVLERAIVVFDVNTGQPITKIPVESIATADRYAISSGGNYLALAGDNRIQMYDLRNGAFAGDLPIDTGKQGYLQIKAIAFSPDGEEIAILVEQSQDMILFCWSMKTGASLAKHVLKQPHPRTHISSSSRHRVIDWLHGGRGWLVQGSAIIDREKGGPVWVADDGLSSITRGVRRVIDEQRFLVLRGDYNSRTLVTEPIPWDTIAEAQRVVSQGGKLQDVGRPDVKPVDWSGCKQLTLGPPSGEYQPALLPAVPANVQPFTVSRQQGQPKALYLLSSDTYRVLVSSDPADYNKRLKGMEISRAGQNADVFELAGGKHLFSFSIPFATELLGVSPSAKQGIYREVQSKDRVDVFNLESGEHRVAFRPSRPEAEPSSLSYNQHVEWAEFVDEEHVLTLTKGGDLVHWTLDGCRANYSLPLGSNSKAYLNPTRSHCLVATGGNSVHLLETATGACCARLTFPNQPIPAPVSDVSFRSDGRLVALLLFLGDKRRLLVWDLQRNSVASDVILSYSTLGMSWCGRAHVALHNTNVVVGGPVRTQQRITVVDVANQRVVWNYMAPIGTLAVDGPGDRLWGLVPDASFSGRQFVSVALPDPEAAGIIAATPPPAPLFGPGTKVALKINMGGLPDELADRREREDQMAKSLDEHFRGALGKAGLQIDDSAPVTLEVSLKNLTQEEILVISSRFSYGGAALIVLSTQSVHARLAIRQGADRVLWEQQNFVGSKDVDASGASRGTSLSSHILLRQWEQAQQWCQATPLPAALHHPDLVHGLGESQLNATSIQLLRKYPLPTP